MAYSSSFECAVKIIVIELVFVAMWLARLPKLVVADSTRHRVRQALAAIAHLGRHRLYRRFPAVLPAGLRIVGGVAT